MAPEQRRLPQLCWLSDKFDTVLMNGVMISIADITKIARNLIDQLRTITQASVLRGFKIPEIDRLLNTPNTSVFDDYQNRNCGYSFLEDSRNIWTKEKLPLVRYLLVTFSKEFIRSSNGSSLQLNIDSVRKWCKSVDRLTKLWIPLIHIIAGQPSRGAEFSAYMIRNSISGERSIYMHASKFMSVQRYQKGQSASGQHKLIARFLPFKLSVDFMIYIAFVRPALRFSWSAFPSATHTTAPEQIKVTNIFASPRNKAY
jgi:hypothetical protein